MNIMSNGRWSYMGGINPRPIAFSFHEDLAPHALTQRLLYEVPNARYAWVSYVESLIDLTAVGTTAGEKQVLLTHVDGNGVETVVFDHVMEDIVTVIQSDSRMGLMLPLSPGESLRLDTVNGEVGGTKFYNVNVAIIEFEREHAF